MTINHIGVIGAGQMGGGIAELCAFYKKTVIVYDIHGSALEKGLANISRSLDKLVKKEKISQEKKQETLSRISTTLRLEDLAKTDLIVEAATENETIKFELFQKLSSLVSENTLLASNTSSISISSLASKVKHPERVIGMHFMNPVPVMKLIEIIKGLQTSLETYEQVKLLAETMGKITITSEDRPGFVVNRILMPMINEAIYALMEGVGQPSDIDTGMKLGTNHPMGPLELADFIGLDTCLSIMDVLHQGFGDTKYRACPLLRTYVHAGWLGRKSGRGFYKYE